MACLHIEEGEDMDRHPDEVVMANRGEDSAQEVVTNKLEVAIAAELTEEEWTVREEEEVVRLHQVMDSRETGQVMTIEVLKESMVECRLHDNKTLAIVRILMQHQRSVNMPPTIPT